MNVDEKIARLKQHRAWAKVAVRFCGSDRELLEDSQQTIALASGSTWRPSCTPQTPREAARSARPVPGSGSNSIIATG
jgi:hypothetical protein